MKKITLTLLTLFCTIGIYAQQENKFRVDFGIGYTAPKGGGGILVNLEPKWNIKDNMAVGIRLGAAAMAKEIEISDDESSSEAKLSSNGSYVGTFEYNFNNGNSSFAPFVGAGIGYFSIANLEFSSSDTIEGQTSLDASGKIGGMLRTGFDWGKFRLAAEYNLIPESEVQNLNGDNTGEIANSYLGVSLGFFVGGGKWGR
ncbi:outer membrane beta-barrel protein [Aquimarina sp. ERC-38]|uniref:outer membrane beta-barrel protein n=1 Tax=Aquimarina sp. ERC-38 TaxID=2949996 RepID=UPI0022478935|nr:outer membrane beta-barrel protein [Aquimarina sp. ERC-38]UZO80324.1 outer membrane beta-barrel protein [Aquimarina sp. ERC-38]